MMIDGWMVVEINGIFSKLINPFHLENLSVLVFVARSLPPTPVCGLLQGL